MQDRLLFTDPLASTLTRGRVGDQPANTDPFWSAETYQAEWLKEVRNRRISRILRESLLPHLRQYAELKRNSTPEAPDPNWARLQFDLFDIYRLQAPQANLMPWESTWLARHHASVWDADLLLHAPSQYEMAQQHFREMMIPSETFALLESLTFSEKERIGLRGLRADIDASATKLTNVLPSLYISRFLLEAVTTVFVNMPELALLVTTLQLPLSLLSATAQTNAYDFANDAREISFRLRAFLQIFCTHPIRGLLLSNHPATATFNPARFTETAVNHAIANYDLTKALLNQQAALLGIGVGSATATARGSVLPLAYASLTNYVAKWHRQWQMRQRRERVNPILNESDAQVSAAERKLHLTPITFSLPYIQEAWTGLREAGRTRSALLHETNRGVFQTEVMVKSVPSMVVAGLRFLGLQAAEKIAAPFTLSLATTYEVTSHAGRMQFTLAMAAGQHAEQQKALVSQLQHLVTRLGELHLAPVEMDAGPISGSLQVRMQKNLDGSEPIFDTIELSPGITVLTGGSGGGKTTLQRVVGFPALSAELGKVVTAQGADVTANYSLEAWQRRISTVSFDMSFPHTLAEQIAFMVAMGETSALSTFARQQTDYGSQFVDLPIEEQQKAAQHWQKVCLDQSKQVKHDAHSLVFDKLVKDYLANYFACAADHPQLQRFLTTAFTQQAGVSAGEKARLSLALSLMKDADIYIYDEPTSNLDPVTKQQIAQIILNQVLAKRDKIHLMAIHDAYLLDILTKEADVRRIYDYSFGKEIKREAGLSIFLKQLQSFTAVLEDSQHVLDVDMRSLIDNERAWKQPLRQGVALVNRDGLTGAAIARIEDGLQQLAHIAQVCPVFKYEVELGNGDVGGRSIAESVLRELNNLLEALFTQEVVLNLFSSQSSLKPLLLSELESLSRTLVTIRFLSDAVSKGTNYHFSYNPQQFFSTRFAHLSSLFHSKDAPPTLTHEQMVAYLQQDEYLPVLNFLLRESLRQRISPHNNTRWHSDYPRFQDILLSIESLSALTIDRMPDGSGPTNLVQFNAAPQAIRQLGQRMRSMIHLTAIYSGRVAPQNDQFNALNIDVMRAKFKSRVDRLPWFRISENDLLTFVQDPAVPSSGELFLQALRTQPQLAELYEDLLSYMRSKLSRASKVSV